MIRGSARHEGPVVEVEEHAVGVDRIVLLSATRSVVRWEGERGARQIERLRSVARQAAMQSRRVRLPVIDDAGRLVGIVSRGDLLRVYLRRDQAIRTEIIEDVLVRTMGEPPSSVGVEVSAGRVVLSGTVARRSLIPVLVELCGSVTLPRARQPHARASKHNGTQERNVQRHPSQVVTSPPTAGPATWAMENPAR